MTYNDALKLVSELRTRFDSGFSSSDKSNIELMYQKVLRKDFVKTSCNDCYRDAVIEIYSCLKREGKMKEKCDYSLKNGVLLQIFGSNEMYTNANLTNEAAEKYLRKNPAGENLFAHLPSDWEERVSKDNGENVELNAELVAVLTEELRNGVTKTAIKEKYKGYQIEGKSVTARLLADYIKAADEVVKSDTEKTEKTESKEDYSSASESKVEQ